MFTPPNYDDVAQKGFAKLDELASGPPEPREPAAREAVEAEAMKFIIERGWEDDNYGVARVAAEFALAYSAELRAERDKAVDMLRVLMEETLLAGYPGGDRNQTLANVRNMKASLLQAREALQKLTIFARATCGGLGHRSTMPCTCKEFIAIGEVAVLACGAVS